MLHRLSQKIASWPSVVSVDSTITSTQIGQTKTSHSFFFLGYLFVGEFIELFLPLLRMLEFFFICC